MEKTITIPYIEYLKLESIKAAYNDLLKGNAVMVVQNYSPRESIHVLTENEAVLKLAAICEKNMKGVESILSEAKAARTAEERRLFNELAVVEDVRKKLNEFESVVKMMEIQQAYIQEDISELFKRRK